MEKVVFSARLCENDTVYFITDEDYRRICRKGRLLGQVMPLPDYQKNKYGIKKSTGIYNLREESRYKLFGYNVNAKDNYTAKYRQTVIMFMFESGLTNKYEFLKYIDFNVNNHINNPNNRIAISKW